MAKTDGDKASMHTADVYERLCLCQALRRTARQVARRYETALRPVGLTAGQFTILAALSRPSPTAIGRLAADLGMDRTTLTRDLRPLQRRDLIQFEPMAKDGRVRTVALSASGREVLSTATPLWRAAQTEALERLGDVDWATVRSALDRLAI